MISNERISCNHDAHLQKEIIIMWGKRNPGKFRKLLVSQFYFHCSSARLLLVVAHSPNPQSALFIGGLKDIAAMCLSIRVPL